jgi:hypothetical protein
MQVYQFRSPLGRHSFGFSVDQQGRNLPASLGPWEVVGVHDVDVLNPHLLNDLRAYGYCLVHGANATSAFRPGKR